MFTQQIRALSIIEFGKTQFQIDRGDVTSTPGDVQCQSTQPGSDDRLPAKGKVDDGTQNGNTEPDQPIPWSDEMIKGRAALYRHR